MKADILMQASEAHYGASHHPWRTFFAPGRVNIIGEHQDYNGGHVFPAALTVGIYGAVRLRDDKKIRLYSANMDTAYEVDLQDPIVYDSSRDWANYPLGMVAHCLETGVEVQGMDLYFDGDLPAGAGLSSSACILDLMGYILWTLAGKDIDRTALAQAAQQVEFHFVGVKVGIMDQFAISQGKEGQGVLLDCTKMEFELVPVTWGPYELVIMNTNKQRGLIDSKFNERKGECDAALAVLQKYKNLSGLSLYDYEDLDYIENENLRRRARHAQTENRRVLDFVKALKSGNHEDVARLLNASHDSLRYDFDVTGFELNSIVDLARQQRGCIASRMIGAGFGGCAIALVQSDAVEDFHKSLPKAYEALTGIQPSLYDAALGDGVHEIK